ncbi:MAG: PhzF family phenazine biosynthesis protein [Gemmatimonadetes bacterium]|nr:PhzF family phenazine biosynthesis protein [Gemmatimonadota bacterium]
MRHNLEFHVLDVFTDRVFGGNPLGVFPDAASLDDALMQAIAREMNLSETVFLSPAATADGTRRVRIFTPAVEVPFAGHPTIGTAWFLVASGSVPVEGDTVTVRLDENVGRVPVEVTLEGGEPSFARFTTAVLPEHRPVEATDEELARLLSLEPADLGARGLEPETVSTGLPYTIVPVRGRDALERCRLDLPTWDRLLRDSDGHHVYVAAPDASGDADFRVRMFAPGSGVPEDPATGSAAAAFAGYLGRRQSGDGVHTWRLVQGVEMGRPSRLEAHAEVRGGEVVRVRVGGQAVHVSRGVMEVPA